MTDPKTTAIIVVDMQNDVKELVPTTHTVVEPINRLLGGGRKKGVTVVYNLRIHRSDGSDVERFRIERFGRKPYMVEGTKGAEVMDELKPGKGDYLITKHRFDGFFETDMHMILSRLGIRTLIVCGVQTPACVRATVIGALERDYDVIVISDATTAATPEVHKANLFDMQNLGSKVMTVDAVLAFI